MVPGTLANWDPTGRWFLTGIQVGYQCAYFRKEFTIPAGQMPGSLALRGDWAVRRARTRF
jgi:hypothetical protein